MNVWLSTLAMVVLAIASFWVLQQLDQPRPEHRPVAPHEPDYYIDDMVRTTTGIEGELRNILKAEQVRHYPDDDSIELDSPHLEIYNGHPQPWHVIAETGWVSSGADVVLLHGEVEIWRYGDAGARQYEVLTTELRVLPKEQYAETDSPAKITGPSTVTHTIGMRANFAHDRLELLERVRSRYEVKPQG